MVIYMDERQEKLLKEIVESYIKNVKPAKYETINHKVDKNMCLNNGANPLEEIKYNYLGNKIKKNQNNSENIARINMVTKNFINISGI